MSAVILKIYRFLYKYSIAARNSTQLFFRSFSMLPFGSWVRFWMPGVSYTKEVMIRPLTFTIHGRSFFKRIADLFMIVSCVRDRQYNPPAFEIKEGDTIVDIGGHIGSFSLFAATQAHNGHIYVFEPDPNNFSCLEANVRRNQFANIMAHQIAIAASTGTRTLYTSGLNTAESSFYQHGTKAIPIAVPCISLHDMFEQYAIARCDFLKLDCEGAEYEILFTAPAADLQKIAKITMECHNPDYFNVTHPANTIPAMIRFLQQQGFSVTEVKENAMHSILFAKRVPSVSQKNGNI